MAQWLFDWIVFGNLWVALAAAALCLASGRALGGDLPPAIPALAFCGTFAVYTVDRLRDLARDRETSPERTAFVESHRGLLRAAAVVALLAAGALGGLLGPSVVGVCTAVLAIGLAHRRLKHRVLAKPIYLTLTWTAVGVGLPWAARGDIGEPGAAAIAVPVAFVVGGSVLANVILSNLRDGEGGAVLLGSRRARALAGAVAAIALLAALLGPAALRPLAWLPLAMGAAVAGFRPGERYGMGVVDGALVVGALLALL